MYVQRGPSGNASSRGGLSPSSSAGIISNAAGNFNNPKINRVMAEVGTKPKAKEAKQPNVQANPSRIFNLAAAASSHHYEDDRSEYSIMSLPQFSQFGTTSASGLPVVRQGVQTTERKHGMVVNEMNYHRTLSQRSHSPGDPMAASHSTTTFSYQTGTQPGEQGKTYATVYSQFRDENAMPQTAELSAMVEEQKAYERERAKQEKAEQFKQQIDRNAQAQLKQQLENQRREKEEKRLKEREVMLRSKEYAAQQREQAKRKALEKKEKGKQKEEGESKPQPDALVRTHVVTTFRSNNADLQQSPIDERDAESEYSHKPQPETRPPETEEQAAARSELERRNSFIMMYKRID